MIFINIIGKLGIALLVLVVILLFALMTISGPYKEPQVSVVAPPPSLPPLEELLPEGLREDSEIMLRVLSGGSVVEMSMERYLLSVVAAEMPASFPLEALKAQAIAARTMVLYNVQVLPSPIHPQADVCTDYSCCMAYKSDNQLRESWGDGYLDNIMRIISAVVGTDGIYMLYDDEPILAVFHSSSAGKTESSGNVWLVDLPYLVSVNTPETDATVPDFVTTVSVSYSEFIGVITGAYPDADLGDDDAGTWVNDIIYTESGRILELTIGGVTIKGTELRSLFNLRSTAIAIEFDEGGAVFTVTGYGHGVGMSQYGAATMARDGSYHKDILSAYYRGVVFSDAP